MVVVGEDGVRAVVGAAPWRRVLACGVIYGLGAVVVYLTLRYPPAIGWLVVMLLFGFGVLYLAERLRQATREVLVWRDDGLYTGSGEKLAGVEDIVRVDRGAFAFKPSSGFSIKLSTKRQSRWAPGIWWRLGRVIGVGGTVSAGQAKFMAEQIAICVAEKQA